MRCTMQDYPPRCVPQVQVSMHVKTIRHPVKEPDCSIQIDHIGRHTGTAAHNMSP